MKTHWTIFEITRASRALWAACVLFGCGSADPPSEARIDTVPSECVNSFAFLTLPDHSDHPGHHATGPDPMESALPRRLSDTLLYEDIANKVVHPAVKAFTPAFELWSDGAAKQRWVWVPECDRIDTMDMDDWQLPVGTTLFKEFSLDGKRIETRIIARIGVGPRDFAFASYLWNEAESDANLVESEGQPDARGTSHDIPSKADCLRCHGSYALGGGRPSRALGFSALQLAHEDAALPLTSLNLSHAPPPIAIPGDATERAALGYLHANCGHCHNGTADRVPHVDLNLALSVDTADVRASEAWLTTVDQPNTLFNDQHVSGRIVPGDPDASALWVRMQARGSLAQMPPIGSEIADSAGLATVRAWIESLP